MTSEQLQSLLTGAGWGCRTRHAEVVMETCYFCGNTRWNLECNAEKGVYHSWCCRRGGRLDELLTQLTGQHHSIEVTRGERSRKKQEPVQAPEVFRMVPADTVPSAADYLVRRSITPKVGQEYGLAVCTEVGHRLYGRIVIPMKDFWTGTVLGWVGRSYTGGHPKYLSTLPESTVTGWRVRSSHAPAVVVEGPLDGISVHRAGFHAAVLSGLGATGVVDWAARMAPDVPIYVMLDGEARKEALQLMWKISPVHGFNVKVVTLAPGQDPANLGPALVQEFIGRSKETPVHS